jgi:phosphotransferase family enzyme
VTRGEVSASPRLGRAATVLLASLEVDVARVEGISSLPSARARKRCYRIDLADGRTVKLRRSTSAQQARRYGHLVVTLQDPRLARVLARRGDLTLEEWIAGTTLESRDVSARELAWGGELLGTLHAIRRVGVTALPPTVSTRPIRTRLEADLRAVVELGAISRRIGARLRSAAAHHDPGTAWAGVLHTDLCPENLVRDTAGTIRVVDNEGMQIGATGFDLARVWYRLADDENRMADVPSGLPTALGPGSHARALPVLADRCGPPKRPPPPDAADGARRPPAPDPSDPRRTALSRAAHPCTGDATPPAATNGTASDVGELEREGVGR